MGRFDILTQLDQKSAVPTKKENVSSSITQNADLPANMQTRKDVSMQASKPVNPQARLHTNLQTGKPVFLEKYSTYLTPECKRGLKRIAFETDRKDYEVLMEAVEQYMERQKPPR